MEISVTQEHLNTAVATVSRVATQRTSLPILSSILITAGSNNIFLTATNLEMAVTVRLAGKTISPGSVALPARLTSELISSLPKTNLNLKQNQKHGVVVKADKHKATINGADPEEYPTIPKEAAGQSVKIETKKFKKALQETVLAASNDEARQTLTGIYVHTKNGELNLVATDSYRLAEVNLGKNSTNLKHIVPVGAMQEVLRILGDGDNIEIVMSENQAVFKIGETTIISRLIDGNYPDYKQIIPKNFEVEAVVDKGELLNLTKIAALFARESAGSIKVSVSEEDQQVSVESVTSQAGENTSNMDGVITGEGQVSLNARYLIDALQVIDTEKVSLNISGKHTPCVLRPVGSDDYTHLIMPLKS